MKQLYYFIFPLLILGISLGYTIFIVALLAFLPLMFTTNKHTLGIFFVMYGGPLGGVIRAMYPFLPIYGLLIVFFGFYLIKDLVVDLFQEHHSALVGILVTMLMFGMFYLIGPQDDNAKTKYVTMCTNGILMVFAYYAFDTSKKVDAEGLTQLLLMASICMFTYAIEAANIRPAGLFDYNWFRRQLIVGEDRASLVTYQQIGMLVLFSLAIFFSQIRLKLSSVLFYLICTGQLVLSSGCRQAILGVALVTALRFSVFRLSNVDSKQKLLRLLGIVVGLVFFYLTIMFFLRQIQSEVVSETLAEGDFQRERIFEQAWFLYLQNPMTGVGLGGYYFMTGDIYPHNFFMELLSETGLLGTISSLLLLFIPLIRKKQGVLHINKSNQFFFLIVFGTFVRVMVSSDLTESIELFSAVFAITAANRIKKLSFSSLLQGNPHLTSV